MAKAHPTLDIPWKEEIFFPHPSGDTDRGEVLRVAHERWGPSFRIDWHGTASIFLGHLIRGDLAMTIEGQTFRAGAGSLIWRGTRESGSFHRNGGELELRIVTCSAGFGPEVERLLGSPSGMVALRHPLAVEDLMERIFEEASAREAHGREICRAYVRILLRVAARERLLGDGPASQAERTFHRCRQAMERCFSGIRSPGETARACGIDPAYMNRLFRRFASTTPGRYLDRLKMNRAAELLRTTPLSVKEIAALLSYDDPYTFSRAFKRVLGLAPQPFREGRE